MALAATAIVGCGAVSGGAGDLTGEVPTTVPEPTAPGSSPSTATDDHAPSGTPTTDMLAPTTGDQSPPPQASDTATPQAGGAVLRHLVTVTFDVDWRPEPELSAEQVSAQRDRVARAQASVLDALGEDADLRREHHATAQASLKVSDHGLARLEELPEVDAVQRDTPAPAN